MAQDIYTDIALRTGGDIYIGVVGPVRTGKSTFINRFMEQFVIPNIESDFRKERAIDELPQSSAGKTIMTTEPKFIPEEAVRITIDGGASFNVRMIDCVGYIIPSAIGYIENDAPRMVDTPWFDEPVPFNMAAEVGTEKVITQHSTIGLVVTTDGSITDLPRDEYEECEQRVIKELQSINKPFVVLLNSLDPTDSGVIKLAQEMSEKYSAPVLPVSCIDLDEDDIRRILTQVLYAFPVKEINISMAGWINSLEKGHWLKQEVFDHIREAAASVGTLRDISSLAGRIAECQYITSARVDNIDLGSGSANVRAELMPSLFFKVIGLTHMPNGDMSPRIDLGDFVMYYRLDRDAGKQDVVVLEKATPDSAGKRQLYICRVVATAGDTVDFTENGQLVINGTPMIESNIYSLTLPYEGYTTFPLTLGEGECFVLADQRDGGADSRYFGPVQKSEIIGTVITIVRRNNL